MHFTASVNLQTHTTAAFKATLIQKTRIVTLTIQKHLIYVQKNFLAPRCPKHRDRRLKGQ